MCGVVGYIGRPESADNAVPFLIEGLRRLEYRGYDSAGVATIDGPGIEIVKKRGKVDNLVAVLPESLSGHIGIAHTRWATHGEPSDINAHPHLDAAGSVAVVHNGIIENARELRQWLEGQGTDFVSDTDSEIFAHLIAHHLEGHTPEEAVRRALQHVNGAYGLLVLLRDHPDCLVAARKGSPLLLGIGDGRMYVGSDPQALVRHTQQVVYLDDEEIAVIDADSYRVINLKAESQEKPASLLDVDDLIADKGEHEHYMLKEILEQPNTLRRALRGRLDERFATARLDGLNLAPAELQRFRRVRLLGCGSALIAARYGAHAIETLARVPCEAESAAEFRYRHPVIEPDTLFIVVSQSGETADTLAAVEEIKRKGGTVVGVVNVVGSSIARACHGGIYLHAGAEISVVSTKAFTAMQLCLLLFALHLGRMKDLSPKEGRQLVAALSALPETIEACLADRAEWAAVGESHAGYDQAFFIGRCGAVALAEEGALKLKEVSYIHAEAYAASELKHGPLAMISEDLPTFVILPDDELREKMLSSVSEIRARQGKLVGIVQNPEDASLFDDAVLVPRLHPLVDGITLTIPMQVVAYHAALARGCNIDQPRNLAKSVTVE
ncbi:MAG: glutamine--fructose-6-phosphate transaminase (isomerizing) [Gammaproteobacteria bacterium]|nr:MAG: glutamine--fructose-6-phosphate transaminase (isomerizing) [Gammaproteobacteria bacterium]